MDLNAGQRLRPVAFVHASITAPGEACREQQFVAQSSCIAGEVHPHASSSAADGNGVTDAHASGIANEAIPFFCK